MVVLFRLIGALIASFFKPPLEDVLAQSAISMRVWPNDIDLNVHANSGRYLSFMDVGRMAVLVRMRLLRKVLKRGWRPVAGAASITYRRSLLPFERFTVKSRIVGWDEKWFYFEHIVENRAGEVAAMAFVRGMFRGNGRNVPPAEFVALAGWADQPSPLLPAACERWRESLSLR